MDLTGHWRANTNRGYHLRTVLIADDRASSRELIRIMLEHSGFLVVEASNGSEALLQAQINKPDLVLLDLQMPVKDGFQVLRELRADDRFRDTPIVAVTAGAMQGDKERALKSGFTGYLSKPLNLSALRSELSRVFRDQ